MIHSFIVATASENVLLERLYSDSFGDLDSFCSSLFSATRRDWAAATVQRVATLGCDVTCVYQQVGGLLFFLSGTDEYDELVLAEALQCLVELVVVQCEKGLSENEFLAQYDRISLLVDCVVRHGTLEQTNKDVLSALVNLSPETVTDAALRKTQLERVSVPSQSVPAVTAAASANAASSNSASANPKKGTARPAKAKGSGLGGAGSGAAGADKLTSANTGSVPSSAPVHVGQRPRLDSNVMVSVDKKTKK